MSTRQDSINALYRLKFRITVDKRNAQLVYPNVRDTGFDSRRLKGKYTEAGCDMRETVLSMARLREQGRIVFGIYPTVSPPPVLCYILELQKETAVMSSKNKWCLAVIGDCFDSKEYNSSFLF